MAGKTYTLKEMREITGCSMRTVMTYVKKFYPDLVKHGKKTVLPEHLADDLARKLPKRNFVWHGEKNG